MNNQPPVIFVHGFIGTLDVQNYDHPHAAPDLLGYGQEQFAPFNAISLQGQVEYLRTFVDTHFEGKAVDVVGHSVGGVIAMLFAHRYPDYVRRIVNVEGNFTLADAFWSASVGRMSEGEADAMLADLRADPMMWLGKAVTSPSPHLAETATRWLAYQPAATLRAMGQSVVTTTGNPAYLDALAQVFESHPVYLLAGERSLDSWNIPNWGVEKCAGQHTIANSGHLMMLDNPAAFTSAIKTFLSH